MAHRIAIYDLDRGTSTELQFVPREIATGLNRLVTESPSRGPTGPLLADVGQRARRYELPVVLIADDSADDADDRLDALRVLLTQVRNLGRPPRLAIDGAERETLYGQAVALRSIRRGPFADDGRPMRISATLVVVLDDEQPNPGTDSSRGVRTAS